MLRRIPAGHVHTNCKVAAADLADPASTAVIELESGERICGHLIIAADGMNSTLRNQLLPKCQPTYAGYLAWRGIARVEDLSGEVQHLLTGKATMYKVSSCRRMQHLLFCDSCSWICDTCCPRICWCC